MLSAIALNKRGCSHGTITLLATWMLSTAGAQVGGRMPSIWQSPTPATPDGAPEEMQHENA